MQEDLAKGDDINEVFNNILCIEDNTVKASYKEGYNKGVSESNLEGYHLGYHRGAEIGSELGYYNGLISAIFNKLSNKQENSEKLTNSVNSLNRLLHEFPHTNIEDVDIIELLNVIRGKLKKIRALLKIDTRFPKPDALSF